MGKYNYTWMICECPNCNGRLWRKVFVDYVNGKQSFYRFPAYYFHDQCPFCHKKHVDFRVIGDQETVK